MEATTQLYDDQIHQFKSVLLPSGGGSQLLTVAVAENKIPHPPGTKKSSSKKVSSQEQLVVASVSEHCPRDIHVGDILMALEGLSGGDGDRHAGQSSSITFSAATNIPEALERTKDEPSRRLILQVPGTTTQPEHATTKSHNFATGKKHKYKTKKSTPTRSSKKATLVPSSSSSKKKKTTTPRKMTVTAAASENSSPNTGKQLPIKVAKSSSSSKAKLSSVKRLTGSSPPSSSSNKNKEDSDCTERRAQNMTDTPSGRSTKSDGVDDSSKPTSSSFSKCKSPSSPLIEILDLSSSTCNSPVVIHEKKKQPKQPSSSTTKSPSEVVSSVFSALCSVPSKIMDISSLVKKKTVVLDQPSPPTILTTSVKEEGHNGDVDPSVLVDDSSSKTLSDQTAQKKKSISSTTPTSKKKSKQPVKSSLYPTIAKTKKKGGGGTKKSKTQKPSPPPPPSIPLSKSSLEPFVDFLASLKRRELRVLLILILSQFPNHGSAILKGHSTTVPSAASSKSDSAPSFADLWDSTNGSRQSLVLDLVQKSSTHSMRWLTIRALDCILVTLPPAVDPIKAVSSCLTKVVETAVQVQPGLARHTTSLAAKLLLLPGHPGSVLLVASSSK